MLSGVAIVPAFDDAVPVMFADAVSVALGLRLAARDAEYARVRFDSVPVFPSKNFFDLPSIFFALTMSSLNLLYIVLSKLWTFASAALLHTQPVSAGASRWSSAFFGRADFSAAESELVDTVDSLSRATLVLKKNLGLLQSGRVSSELSAMMAPLSKIVEASWVNEHQNTVLQSLIQAGSQDSDEDLELQPQATSEAYSSQSGGILDTIADMQEKAEESLSKIGRASCRERV